MKDKNSILLGLLYHIYFKITTNWLFIFLFVPDTDREEEYCYNNHGTHRTKWTKYPNDKLLIDYIWVETNSTKSHPREYFCRSMRTHKPPKEWKYEKNWIYDSSYHRKCYFEFSNRKYDSSRILQYSTTREGIRKITRHHLESEFVSSIPVFISRDREIDCIEYANKGESSNDQIFTHRKNKLKNKNSHKFVGAWWNDEINTTKTYTLIQVRESHALVPSFATILTVGDW